MNSEMIASFGKTLCLKILPEMNKNAKYEISYLYYIENATKLHAIYNDRNKANDFKLLYGHLLFCYFELLLRC